MGIASWKHTPLKLRKLEAYATDEKSVAECVKHFGSLDLSHKSAPKTLTVSATVTAGSLRHGNSQLNKSKKAKPTKPPPTAKSAKKPAATAAPTFKTICDNRKARHKYEIMDAIECGVMLVGSEVKSLRNGKCQLDEAYGRVKGQTLWLVSCDIAEYPQATVWNHEPKRPRQLLVHKREMTKFVGRANEKGLTLVPLRMYFNERGIVKCEIALCKGLKLHDKREKMKKADAKRDISRAVRRRI